MGALADTKMTIAEFVEWTNATRGAKYELEAGVPVEMAAEQARHALTKHAAARAIEDAVARASLDCKVFPDGMMLVIDSETVRIPDAVVQCAPVDPEATKLDHPVIVIEVASPSSASRDENYKLAEYFSLPSVRHYLLLFPEKRNLIHFHRESDSTEISTRITAEGTIDLIPPGISVTVEELFGKVDR